MQASSSANANGDPGFKLPGTDNTPASSASAPAAPASSTTPAPPATSSTQIDGAAQTDTSTRDLTLGGGIFLVLLLAFFFARGAYVNHLVARRVAPSSSSSAGWLLFVGLSFVSASVVLALINSAKYLSFFITGPLVVIGVGALIAALLVGRR